MERNKILVVDDDGDNQRFLGEAIEYIFPDKEVVYADNGTEAWEKIQRTFNLIWLIVTDWNMSGMDGIELTKKIKTTFPEIPVILTSGDSPPAENPADAFLGKPFYISDLATLIQNLTA